MLLHVGLAAYPGFIPGIVVSPFVFFPPLSVLRRNGQREPPLTDEEKAIEEEFKQTIRHMPAGWGMRPEENIKEGRFIFWLGIVIGAGNTALGGASALYFVLNGLNQPEDIFYLVLSLIFCFLGIYSLCHFPSLGLRLRSMAQNWREQTAEVITIQGMFTDEWKELVNRKRLVRIERKDGSSKMLLVGAAFEELLPEIGEEVEIDYLFGCEAVVAVMPLAGAAGTAPAEDQPAEG